MVELDLPQDYCDLLREFVAAGVEFVMVGGWAVAVHGHGRATDDLDLFVRADAANARRIFAALERFGAPIRASGVTEELFANARYGYRLGRRPLMIEILTTIDGVSFADAAREPTLVNVGELRIPVIGRSALLINKRAAGRPKDLADLEALDPEA